jgi:hypothetical protein
MLKVGHERVEKDKDNDVQTDIAACLSVISGLSTDEVTDDSEMNPAISPKGYQKVQLFQLSTYRQSLS